MDLLIDSHCHLNYDYSPKTTEDLIQEAQNSGVNTLITIGTELPTLSLIQKISEAHEQVFHTIGIHPHEAETWTEQDLHTLEAAAKQPQCRAIGEIGLDYYYDHSPREIQKHKLELQLDLALRLNQPVVIHCRNAEEDLLIAIRNYTKKVKSGIIPGVIHCFSGTESFGKSCLDLGFFVSFSGILTFKNAEEIRTSARNFPLNQLLVETDSPYLAPIPFRGKKCEPSMVRYTAQKLAEVKGLSFTEVANATTENARKLFRL